MRPAVLALAMLASAPARAQDPSTDDAQDSAADSQAVPWSELTPAERRARRQAMRIAARRARWQGRVLPKEADFLRTNLDVKARIAFNGTSASPLSILTALGGWNEFGIEVDAGAFNFRGFTVSFGGGIHVGTSLVLGALLANIANYDDLSFSWSMWEAAATARVGFHLTTLQSVDPYLFAGLGGGAFQVSAQPTSWPEFGNVVHTSGQIRVEAGGGLNIPLKGKWVVGVEVRYLLSVQTNPVDRFLFRRPNDIAVFSFAPEHAPPRGFSWVLGAGYRF